jgi:hypothetical protein
MTMVSQVLMSDTGLNQYPGSHFFDWGPVYGRLARPIR